MEGWPLIKTLIRAQDYFCRIDLKDAYLSVPVFPAHRPYLAFDWDGQYYQWTCLPFGLATAPLVFTKLMKPVLASLRSRGVRVVAYLDDLLIMDQNATFLTQEVLQLTHLLSTLGFLVNCEKSVLVPSRQIRFLGLDISSEDMTLRLPPDKLRNLRSSIGKLQRPLPIHFKELESVLGKLSFAASAITPAPLHMRALQGDLIAFQRLTTDSPLLQLSPEAH
jgi:hypothetical protein